VRERRGGMGQVGEEREKEREREGERRREKERKRKREEEVDDVQSICNTCSDYHIRAVSVLNTV
jgi:hypothetical protein